MVKSTLLLLQVGVLIKAWSHVQQCQSSRIATVFRMPTILDCDKKQYETWEVRLYKENIKIYKTNAKVLEIKRRTCDTYTTFVGGKITDKEESRWTINERFAKILLDQNTCIDNQGNIRNQPMIQGFSCKYNWMKHESVTTVSCYHDKGSVFKTYKGKMKTGLADTTTCKYEDKYCETTDGKYLTWETQELAQSEFVEIGDFNVTVIGTHLILPEKAITLSLTNKTGDNEWHDASFKIIRIRKNPLSKGPNVTLQSESLDTLKQNIDMKFQYILDLIRSPKANSVFNCNLYKVTSRLERMLVELDPTIYMRNKLNRTDLIADKVDEFIIVYPCIEAVNVVSKNDSHCYKDVPVTYSLKNAKGGEYSGFLQRDSHNIIQESHPIECDKRPAPEVRDGVLYIWNQHTERMVSMPENQIVELASTIKGEGISFPDDYPRDKWLYTDDEQDNLDFTEEMIKDMYKEKERPKNSKAPLGQDHKLYILSFIGINTHYIGNVVYQTLNWVEHCVFIYLAIKWMIERYNINKAQSRMRIKRNFPMETEMNERFNKERKKLETEEIESDEE